MYIRTSFVCSTLRKENIWSNPHASSIHPVIQTSTIILQTELFPKKRREKIQREILQSSSNTVVFPHIIHSTRTTVFPHAIQQLQDNSTYRVNSSTRNTTTTRLILCTQIEGILQQVFPMHLSILHSRIRLPATLQHSRPTRH